MKTFIILIGLVVGQFSPNMDEILPLMYNKTWPFISIQIAEGAKSMVSDKVFNRTFSILDNNNDSYVDLDEVFVCLTDLAYYLNES